MRILTLSLNGYKRLSLNNVQKFEIDLTDKIQIIIGTNGSGKSSVLKELSPLPAMHTEYHTGGSKVVTISHKNDTYILSSFFNKGQRHSFLRNNVELNTGNTLTVQKELVNRYLNYNSDIHDIMLGNIVFTGMSVSQRRELLTDLSGGGVDFALEVYTKLKDSHRDTQGAIKHIDNLIVDLSLKQLSDEDFEKNKLIVKQIQDNITILMEETTNTVGNMHDELKNAKNYTVALEKIGADILKLGPLFYQPFSLQHLYIINEQLLACNLEYEKNKTLVDATTQELQSIKDILKSFKDTNTNTIDELIKTNNHYLEQIVELKSKIQFFKINITDASTIVNSNNLIRDSLESIVLELPENNGWYSAQRLDESKNLMSSVCIEIERTTREYNQVKHKYDHLKNSDTINCEKCGFSWILGLEGSNEKNILTQLDSLTLKLSTLNTKKDSIKIDIEKLDNYKYILKKFRDLTTSFPQLKPFWDKVIDDNLVTKYPKQILSLYEHWEREIIVYSKIENINKSISDISEVINHTNLYKTQAGSLSMLNEKAKLLEHNLNLAIVEKQYYMKKLTKIKGYLNNINYFIEMYAKFESMKDKINDSFIKYMKISKDILIKDLIRGLHNDLAKFQSSINDTLVAKRELSKFLTLVDDTKVEEKVFKAMLEILSPVDGLIAKHLKGFLENFIIGLNSYIENIWTYPLTVKNCDYDSGELDYKFPMLIGANELFINDISMGSSAQKDIINFVFKLAVMDCKNMSDYPLYLDELAPTLDEKHRINIHRFVHEYVSNNYCSQLFMVSHYQPSYGAFHNAQVCIMDSTNMLNIPTVYNAHVRMH